MGYGVNERQRRNANIDTRGQPKYRLLAIALARCLAPYNLPLAVDSAEAIN
jgi:hypothetical protein